MSDINFDAKLQQYRAEIDTMTTEFFDLIDRRCGVVRKVGKLKSSSLNPHNPAEFYRVDREALMIADTLNRPLEHLPNDRAAGFLLELISTSLSLETTQRIAFVVSARDISGIAAADRFGRCAMMHPCQNLDDVIEKLKCNHADHAIVPLSNETLTRLLDTPDLYLNGRIDYPDIRHPDIAAHYFVISRVPALLTHQMDRHWFWLKNTTISDMQITQRLSEVLINDSNTLRFIEQNQTHIMLDTPMMTIEKVDALLSALSSLAIESITVIGHYADFDPAANIRIHTETSLPQPKDFDDITP